MILTATAIADAHQAGDILIDPPTIRPGCPRTPTTGGSVSKSAPAPALRAV
jgi:hypothetical protein